METEVTKIEQRRTEQEVQYVFQDCSITEGSFR